MRKSLFALLLAVAPALAQEDALEPDARSPRATALDPAGAPPVKAPVSQPPAEFTLVHATGITPAGVVVGVGRVQDVHPRAFSWRDGSFTDLGPTDKYSIALGANERGQVVGCASPYWAPSKWRPILWEHGTVLDLLESTREASAGVAWAINARGQVLILAQMGGPSATRALLWDRGQVTDLGPAAWMSPDTWSFLPLPRINASGDVIALTANGSFFWSRGVRAELGFRASDLNNRGQVVGESFLWENGKITNLGSLHGAPTSATVINERGDIAGKSGVSAFRWRLGHMEEVPGRCGFLMGINARGQIVGMVPISGGFGISFCDGPVPRYFLWDEDELVDLAANLSGNIPLDPIYPGTIMINDAGLVAFNWASEGFFPMNEVFLWKNGSAIELTAAAGTPLAGPVSTSPPTPEAAAMTGGETQTDSVAPRVSPNPSFGPMRIRFAVPVSCDVRASVLDLLGRKVRSLANGPLGAGDHELIWDGADEAGHRTPPGVYTLRMEVGTRLRTTRLLRIR